MSEQRQRQRQRHEHASGVMLGFGNNACLNVDPTAAGPSVIPRPKIVSLNSDCGHLHVAWHSWTCTVAKRGDDDDELVIWGSDPLVVDGKPTSLHFDDDDAPTRVLGLNRPEGYLLQSGRVTTTDGTKSKSESTWRDVVVNALGTVYASNESGVYCFESLDDLLSGTIHFGPLDHPLLKLKPGEGRLYTTETRAFVVTGRTGTGPVQHLLELVDVQSLPPRQAKTSDPVVVKVIDEFEGLGIRSFIPGSANRAAVITEAGEAWLLPSKGEIEVLDFGDEQVRLAGIGSDFELVVTDRQIYVRGKSEWAPKIERR